MSNYPEGSHNDPRAPWNEPDAPECPNCGSVTEGNVKSCCECIATCCAGCGGACEDCGERYCAEHLNDGFCATCAEKFARQERN